jgi:hypothetical protein
VKRHGKTRMDALPGLCTTAHFRVGCNQVCRIFVLEILFASVRKKRRESKADSRPRSLR